MIKNMGLNKMAKDIHAANVEKGFYNREPPLPEQLMLTVSELAEAMEADRKGLIANYLAKDPMLYPDDTFSEAFEKAIKNTIEDEIADTLIRVLDICGYRGIDIDYHVRAKLRYNSLRAYRHGGKKY